MVWCGALLWPGSGSGASDMLGKMSATELRPQPLFTFYFETRSHLVAHASLEVTLESSQALKLQSSCLRLYGSWDYWLEPPHPAPWADLSFLWLSVSWAMNVYLKGGWDGSSRTLDTASLYMRVLSTLGQQREVLTRRLLRDETVLCFSLIPWRGREAELERVICMLHVGAWMRTMHDKGPLSNRLGYWVLLPAPSHPAWLH